MKFSQIEEVLSGKVTGKVSLRGWAYRVRDQKDLVFIMLRDSSGIIQLACKGIKDAPNVTIESSVEIEGTAKEDKRAPGGYEIGVSQLKIIGLAERFPIVKDQSEEFLREQRHLWLRGKRMTSLMKIRAEVFKAFRQFHYDRGYIEFHAPIFTPSEAEGGSTLFEVKYGDKEGVYLTQTWQLYAEAAIFSLERIFTIAPTFRAEKSRTKRHLSEFWMAEMEAAWMDHEQLMEFEEDMIIYIIDYVIKTCKGELEYLERDIDELKKIKKPFMKMPYDEALEILGKPKGYDLTDKDERELLDKVGKGPIHLTQFPRDMKAFYMKVDPKDPKKVKASDLLMPGMGEIIGGSERISDPKELEESLKIFKLKKEDYGWYMDLRKYGTVPHSGFGLGVERLVVWLAGIEHIMDAIAFPRTMDRVYP
ncbi:MAG: asparagine--tRNA ligase [Nanoarchaeota archaeon]|nr:asparagine--tRNA ligase [Nanoarchaeota archaeon]MBU4072455.1 asparagine--tRNA ligase [Candidatus Thermoplasmatota archaeon]MBU4124051.1 asparagine--tRNA ligase [Nanoarchaeota archaeon]